MSDLTNTEKRKFETLLEMGNGYVLQFSNRTFDEFVLDSIGRSIYDPRYGSGSKANQLRGFWKVEANHIVSKLMTDLLQFVAETNSAAKDGELYKSCQAIIMRLKQSSPITDLEAITSFAKEKDFEVIVEAIGSALNEQRQPQGGLDRLHTFVTKYLRSLCELRGVTVTRDKPLHSLLGEYIKKMRGLGHIESEMTERILKTSISNLEAFNDVRNNHSLAHDNPLLNTDETVLIFNNVVSSVRFLRSLEGRIESEKKVAAKSDPWELSDDDVPF